MRRWGKSEICEATAMAGLIVFLAGCNMQWNTGIALLAGGGILLVGGVWGALR